MPDNIEDVRAKLKKEVDPIITEGVNRLSGLVSKSKTYQLGRNSDRRQSEMTEAENNISDHKASQEEYEDTKSQYELEHNINKLVQVFVNFYGPLLIRWDGTKEGEEPIREAVKDWKEKYAEQIEAAEADDAIGSWEETLRSTSQDTQSSKDEYTRIIESRDKIEDKNGDDWAATNEKAETIKADVEAKEKKQKAELEKPNESVTKTNEQLERVNSDIEAVGSDIKIAEAKMNAIAAEDVEHSNKNAIHSQLLLDAKSYVASNVLEGFDKAAIEAYQAILGDGADCKLISASDAQKIAAGFQYSLCNIAGLIKLFASQGKYSLIVEELDHYTIKALIGAGYEICPIVSDNVYEDGIKVGKEGYDPARKTTVQETDLEIKWYEPLKPISILSDEIDVE